MSSLPAVVLWIYSKYLVWVAKIQLDFMGGWSTYSTVYLWLFEVWQLEST